VNLTFRRVIAAAVASAAAFLVGTSAHAATVATIWDPVFGGTLNGDLAWSGQAQFSVPDDCLLNADTSAGSKFVFDTPAAPNGDCNMRLESATVTLYHESVGPGTFETVIFPSRSLVGTGVDGMEVAKINGLNAVVGIRTRNYEFEAATPGTSFSPTGELWMWWAMPDGIDPVYGSTSDVCVNEETQFRGPCNPNDPQYDSNPAPIALLTTCYDRFGCVTSSETIPEPGTLGLALGALGAGWLARRRKKRVEKTA
jgi:hypothetical protein